MADWASLQAIELVKSSLVWHERDEMEHIVVFTRGLGLLIHHEWVLSMEAIVSNANLVRIADEVTLIIGRETSRKLAQIRELGAQIHL